MILKGLTLGPFGSNCFVVGSDTTKEGMIIDPGDEPEAIQGLVKELGLTTIKYIVITHGHMDHVGALKDIKEAYPTAEVAIHEADVPLLEMRWRGMPRPQESPEEAPPKPDRLLRGGDILEVGDLRFTVLHTPGHSPGSICLLGPGVAFTGDTLFNFGVGRTDFPGGSHARLISNIVTKLMVLSDQTLVFPGHGPATNIGVERRYNPFLRG